jgi:hypothetical protein
MKMTNPISSSVTIGWHLSELTMAISSIAISVLPGATGLPSITTFNDVTSVLEIHNIKQLLKFNFKLQVIKQISSGEIGRAFISN